MTAQAATASRGPRHRLALTEPVLAPLGSLPVAIALLGAGPRVLLVVAVPALVVGAVVSALPRGPRAAVALLLAVLALGAGVIARSELLLLAGVLYLVGVRQGWGVNRARRARRAWAYRALAALGAILVLFVVVYPTLLTVGYVAKPRSRIHDAALGLPHERVTFPAADGVRLSGWYAPGRNGAAIVLVHGGGGDREGTVRYARMLAEAGYGVLLYDARGRGESAGHQNAAGWEWHRDVHGAISFLQRRGVPRIGLLGLSTGAEAVVTEAAADPRVGAVVADGLQARTAADTSVLSFGNRISLEPGFAVAGAELQLARGETPPPPLMQAVHRLAAARPLLLIATVPYEREFDRAYTQGTNASLWQLPRSQHTHGLQDQPAAYADRVLALFQRALLSPQHDAR